MSFSSSSTDAFSSARSTSFPVGLRVPARPAAYANSLLTAPAVHASFVRALRIVPTSTQNGSCVCASISSTIGASCALNSFFSALSTAGMSLTSIQAPKTQTSERLAPDDPVSRHRVLVGRQLLEPHGPPRMQLVGGDADLRAHAELRAVGEARGDVMVDAGGIDVAQELLRARGVVGHDAVRMMRSERVDVRDRRAVVRDGPHVHLQGEEFPLPVVVRRVERDALVLRPGPDHREEERRELLVDEQAFRGVADAGALGLRVVENGQRHAEVALVVDVDVADALVVLEDRHERRLAHRADEPLAAAGNRDVDEADAADELRDGGMVEDRDELNGIANVRLRDCGRERPVGLDRLLAAAQDHRVAGLEAQRRGVDEDVGAALEDDGDDAERNADLPDDDAARTLPRPQLLADRVGQRRDVADARDHRFEPGLRAREAVEHRVLDPGLRRARDVDGVGGADRRGIGLEGGRHARKRGVLVNRRAPRGLRRGGTGPDGHVMNDFGCCHSAGLSNSRITSRSCSARSGSASKMFTCSEYMLLEMLALTAMKRSNLSFLDFLPTFSRSRTPWLTRFWKISLTCFGSMSTRSVLMSDQSSSRKPFAKSSDTSLLAPFFTSTCPVPDR